MKALQNWYDEMRKGQRIFVWFVSVVLALFDFLLLNDYFLSLNIKGYGDAPSFYIGINSYLLLGFPFFIPLVICIYLALGSNKQSD